MHNEHADDDANGHVIKFRGIFKPKHISGSKTSVYFFFQKYFKKQKHPHHLSKRDHMWWVISSEIAHFKKELYRISIILKRILNLYLINVAGQLSAFLLFSRLFSFCLEMFHSYVACFLSHSS